MLARLACTLAAALVAAGCSGRSDESGATPPAAQRAPTTATATATTADRSQAVYDAYYRHCREFTWQALAYPGTAKNDEEAARRYAGPPRQYQQSAFRGCLEGLRNSTGRITRAEIKRAAEEEAKEDGLG